MGRKISVGATIARTYRFAFVNYLNNLGAIWMPLTIMFVGTYFLLPHYMAAIFNMQDTAGSLAAANPRDPAAFQQAMQAYMRVLSAAAPYFLALFVIAFVCFSSIAAGLTREAFGFRTGSAYLQFPFGKPVWRLIGAFLLLIVVFMGLYLAMALVTAVVGAIIGVGAVLLGHLFGAADTVFFGIGILTVASFGAFIYVAVRFSFLVAPVTVAEERISLLRGWALTRGNFWRIVAVLLAIWLPLLVAELAYLYWVMGMNFLPPFHPGMAPHEMMALSRHLNALNRQTLETMQSHWYITYPVGLLVTAPIYGLVTGVAAFAYRSLVPVEIPAGPVQSQIG